MHQHSSFLKTKCIESLPHTVAHCHLLYSSNITVHKFSLIITSLRIFAKKLVSYFQLFILCFKIWKDRFEWMHSWLVKSLLRIIISKSLEGEAVRCPSIRLPKSRHLQFRQSEWVGHLKTAGDTLTSRVLEMRALRAATTGKVQQNCSF